MSESLVDTPSTLGKSITASIAEPPSSYTGGCGSPRDC